MAKEVVVQGGGENLYKVSESGRTFCVYKVNVGLIGNSTNNIGQTRSFDDALAIIKAHSDSTIKCI